VHAVFGWLYLIANQGHSKAKPQGQNLQGQGLIVQGQGHIDLKDKAGIYWPQANAKAWHQ